MEFQNIFFPFCESCLHSAKKGLSRKNRGGFDFSMNDSFLVLQFSIKCIYKRDIFLMTQAKNCALVGDAVRQIHCYEFSHGGVQNSACGRLMKEAEAEDVKLKGGLWSL